MSRRREQAYAPVEQLEPPSPGAHAPAEPARGHREVLIAPAEGWMPLNLRELWDHRELLYYLTWRNVKVRYKQTALGAAWAVIPAVLTMIVFTLIFGRLANLDSDGAPYAAFSFAALVPWTYFATTVSVASLSLVEGERLITRVYFPRIFMPLAAALAGLVDFTIAFALLIVLAAGFGIFPDLGLLAVPPLLLLLVLTAFGVSLFLSAANVFYRDVRYVIAFLVQFWLFVSPVAYATSIIPEQWRPVYALNPMVGVIDGFRWAILDTAPAPGATILISIASALVVAVVGLFYFRRVESSFADVI
jgi:lipopolysaccharide transport system permease protein